MENNISTLITMLEDLQSEYIRSHFNDTDEDVSNMIRACIEYAEDLKREPTLARVIDRHTIYPIYKIDYRTEQVTLIESKKVFLTVLLKDVELIRKDHL